MMSASPSSSVVAHTFARAGSLFWVSHVLICSSRPSTPPSWLSWSTRILAAASAGPSKGAIWPDESNAQPIVIGPLSSEAAVVPACVSAGAPSSSSPPHAAAPRARAARSAAALHPILPRMCCVLLVGSTRSVRASIHALRVRGFPAFHERVQGLVQGSLDSEAPRLANERAIDQLHLGRPPGSDVLQHRRVVRAATVRRQDVHLPRVVVKRDARRRGHRLPLV